MPTTRRAAEALGSYLEDLKKKTAGKAGKMSPRSGCYGLSPADGFPGIKGKSEAPLHLAFDMLMPEVEGGTGRAITLFVFHHHDPGRKFTGKP